MGAVRYQLFLLLLFVSAAVAAADDPGERCLQPGDVQPAEEVIRACTQALASEEKKAEEKALFYLHRGQAHARQNLADKALADFQEAIRHNQELPQAHYGQGMLFLHEGDYQGAEQEFETALGLNPDHEPAKAILARIKKGEKLREWNFSSAAEAENRGDFRAALFLYTELLTSDALAGARFPTFAVHDNRANIYLAQEQYPAAIKEFDAALKLNPDYVSALYNRGSAYSVMGRFDMGVKDYSRVITLQPENAAAYFNRGNAYAGMNRFPDAIQDYKKALALKPGWEKVKKTLAEAESISGVYGVFTQGITAEKKGAYAEAIAKYSEVLESGKLDAKNSANVYYARARVHMRRKEYPETLRDLRRAVELRPNWKGLRKTLEAVEKEAKKVEEGQRSEDAVRQFFGGLLEDDAEEQGSEENEPSPSEPQEETAVADENVPAAEVLAEEGGPSESVEGATTQEEEQEAVAEEATEIEVVEEEAVEETPQPAVVVDEHQPGESFRDCEQCPEMIVVPAGSFHMGDTMGTGSELERPPHKVSFKDPFAVAKLETTFAQWDACIADGGCSYKPADDGLGRGERPVTGISWDDAQQYLAWLSGKTGREYRLPTEAEWEYVARAGTIGDTYWRNKKVTCKQANVADQLLRKKDPMVAAFTCEDGYVKTAPAGSFPANKFGIHDIYGNVAEWVEDCWNGNYLGAPADGQAWTSGDCGRRILRGGSWKSGPQEIRASSRVPLWKELRLNTSGLRVVRSLSLQPEAGE
jgi:formylglycine-generating enzyme required for sulfatase activity/tetratricopeptide (TPR) repeat protein